MILSDEVVHKADNFKKLLGAFPAQISSLNKLPAFVSSLVIEGVAPANRLN